MRRASPARAVALALCVALAGVGLVEPTSDSAVLTPPEHRRPAEQTFLTFPEWFLVFSPAEYASLLERRPPSEFPFLGHVAQFWGAYRAVYGAARAYPFNSEYHVMIVVIGASTTLEYGLRRAYETVVGRVSELFTTYGATEEDRLAAQVAREYVELIRVEPWYKFDFRGALARLWRTSLWGDGLLRKWERKYALTTEYAAKAVYGYLMRKGTQASYGEATPTTVAVVRGLPAGLASELSDVKPIASLPDGAALVSLPRYEAFTHRAAALAAAGGQFVEIAGNRDAILVSALVPAPWAPDGPDRRVLYEQRILTRPGRKRVLLVVPVASLHGLLNDLRASALELEHVYDY